MVKVREKASAGPLVWFPPLYDLVQNSGSELSSSPFTHVWKQDSIFSLTQDTKIRGDRVKALIGGFLSPPSSPKYIGNIL